MSTLTLSPEAVNAYREILENPTKYSMDFKPLSECFQISDVATPKHVLYDHYRKYINKPLPKLIFYIIMDQTYPQLIGKAPNGDLGYKLNLNPKL